MTQYIKTVIFLFSFVYIFAFTGPNLATSDTEFFIPKQGIFADPYVSLLQEVFDKWDDGKLILKKSQLEPTFKEKLKQRMEKRPFGYEDEYWQGKILEGWAQLPKVLKPYLKLSLGSRLYLIGLYVDNLDDFKTKVPPQQVEDKLRLPLFIILGTAQPLALKMEAQTINTPSISEARRLFYTVIYPFCHEGPKS